MAGEDCACACCCASTTVFDNPRVGGLHPEKIVRDSVVLSAREPGSGVDMGGFRYQLVNTSIHLVGLSVFADPGNASGSTDLKGVSCQFFTTQTPDDEGSYDYITTIVLKPGENYSCGDEITGAWLDSGLYVVVFGNSGVNGSNSYDDRVAVNLTYLDRKDYTPAYQDPLSLNQYYWSCNRSDDLYHNWYGGTQSDTWVDNSDEYIPDTSIQMTITPTYDAMGTDGHRRLHAQSGDFVLDENNNYLMQEDN